MGDVINFGDTKVMRLERELKRTQEELEQSKTALLESNKKLGTLNTVNDMLKLQIVSLIKDMQAIASKTNIAVNNLKTLQSKLPDIQA